MDNLDKMISDKRKYTNLKISLEQILNYLNSCIENLEVPTNRLKDLYSFDSISADKDKLKSTREDLINKRNTIKNVILPEIKKQLKQLNQQIGG